MAFLYPPAVRRLVNELNKLPTIGEKSAQRLAYHLLSREQGVGMALADALREALTKTTLCELCYFLSEGRLCSVCSDERRDRSLLCVVEKPADVLALEKSGAYRGLYHVLHGLWSPLKGVRPEHTKIGELVARLEAQRQGASMPAIKEVILATGTTVEGDATALYIANCVQELGVRVTRIAQGLPKGGELEYADELTLNMSLENRKQL